MDVIHESLKASSHSYIGIRPRTHPFRLELWLSVPMKWQKARPAVPITPTCYSRLKIVDSILHNKYYNGL